MNVRSVVAVVTAALLATAGPSVAEQLSVGFNAGTSLELNDNPRLVSDDIESVSGIVASAAADVRWGEESWQLSFNPRVIGRRYTGDYELDSRDIYTTAGYLRKTQLSQFDAALEYSRESTLTSELVATGVVDQNVPRETLGARASLTHSPSPRLALTGSVAYQDVTYEDGLRYGLQDSDYWLALGIARFEFNERTSVNLITRLGNLDVSQSGDRSREVTVGLGIERGLTERWQMDLSAGPTYSSTNDGPSTTGYSYRGGITGQWERSQVRLHAERLLSPLAGQGRLQTRESFRVSFSHGLRESLRATAFAATDSFEDINQGSSASGYQSGTDRVGIGLNWQPAPQWSWQGSYEYIVRDSNGSPDGNRLLLGLVWSARPLSLSF